MLTMSYKSRITANTSKIYVLFILNCSKSRVELMCQHMCYYKIYSSYIVHPIYKYSCKCWRINEGIPSCECLIHSAPNYSSNFYFTFLTLWSFIARIKTENCQESNYHEKIGFFV